MLFRSEALGGLPLRAEGAYMLRPERGVLPHSHGDVALSGQVLQALQAALDGGDLRALQLTCAHSLPALKLTLRQWLHYHLGAARLHTREVMLASQQLAERPPEPEDPSE